MQKNSFQNQSTSMFHTLITDPSLGPAPHPWFLLLRLSNLLFSTVSGSRAPKEIISNFWKTCSAVSERGKQKGRRCAHERCIHNIICRHSFVNDETIEIEGRAQRSPGANMRHRTSWQFRQRTNTQWNDMFGVWSQAFANMTLTS